MRLARCLLILALSAPLWGQSGAQLKMDLDHLEKKADEVVSVNLEGESLEGGRRLLALKKGVTAPVKKLVSGLKGIYLRRFWFGKEKAYDEDDVKAIRQQMTGPGWVPMMEMKDRRKPEAVTIYSYMENETVTGLAVLSEEGQEVTVVNIVGPVDLETLSELGEQMGLPAMKIATTELLPGQAPPVDAKTKPAQPKTK